MGKKRIAVIGDESTKDKNKSPKKQKQSLKKEKGTRVPGLKGGERIVAVEPEPVETDVKKQEEEKKTKKQKRPHTRGEKYTQARKQVNKAKLYKLDDAIKLVKKLGIASFDESLEIHAVLKKDGVTQNIDLPHSTGKDKKIEIANDKTIEKLKEGVIDFDILLATADMMPKIVPFAKILGPKGLMPNPKNGTLIKSEKDAEKFSGNTIQVKTEKDAPLIHIVFGKASQPTKELVENAHAIFEGIGPKLFTKVYIKSTMSPSVKVDIAAK